MKGSLPYTGPPLITDLLFQGTQMLYVYSYTMYVLLEVLLYDQIFLWGYGTNRDFEMLMRDIHPHALLGCGMRKEVIVL